LDDMAAYITANTTHAVLSFSSMAFFILTQDMNLLNSALTNEKVLRLYGLLGVSQRQALSSHGAIPLGRLSDDQRAQVARLLYGSNPWGGGRPLLVVNRQRGARFDSLETEPTEAFPNGLPGDGEMTMDAETHDAVVPADGSTSSSAMTAETFANNTFYAERSDLFPNQPTQTLPTLFHWASETKVLFNFTLSADLSMSSSVDIVAYDRRADPVPFSGLPQSFRDAYDAQLKRERSSYKDMKPSDVVPPGHPIKP